MLTGQLGDVMQESAQAALSFIRSRAEELGIDPRFHRKYDIHVHVPEGAIPKDGPSAGITMATALASQMTLRGKVLAIGGVKEKVLAAYRYGARNVILPKANEKDLAEIPEDISSQLSLHLVEHIDEVLRLALDKPLGAVNLSGDEGDADIGDQPSGDTVTH